MDNVIKEILQEADKQGDGAAAASVGHDVVDMKGTASIHGNIISGGDLEMSGNASLHYRPPSAAFWPTTVTDLVVTGHQEK